MIEGLRGFGPALIKGRRALAATTLAAEAESWHSQISSD
jgi:hypothetical protein